MALRRMFRRPKLVKLDDQVAGDQVVVDTEVAVRRPAWAPASWRLGTDHPVAAHAGRDDVVVAHSEGDDVLAVAAREIDRMAEEIGSSDVPEEAELSMLQEHARRLEALTKANPFLLRQK